MGNEARVRKMAANAKVLAARGRRGDSECVFRRAFLDLKRDGADLVTRSGLASRLATDMVEAGLNARLALELWEDAMGPKENRKDVCLYHPTEVYRRSLQEGRREDCGVPPEVSCEAQPEKEGLLHRLRKFIFG
jgi:hypothetical protein